LRADIEMTQAIVAVARPLGIAVHDHIIVGKGRPRELERVAADLSLQNAARKGRPGEKRLGSCTYAAKTLYSDIT
jgi:hypothetical protein